MIQTTSISPSQPIPKPASTTPFSRAARRRVYASAKSLPQQNQIEVQGEAYLCFSQDYATFQGNINTTDESNYSIVGEAISGTAKGKNPFPTLSSSLSTNSFNSIESTPNQSDDEDDEYSFRNRQSSSSSSSVSGDNILEDSNCSYNVTLTDHYTGLTHRLPNVLLNSGRINYHISNVLRSASHKHSTTDGQIYFKIENSFKGQRADMMIQKHIGVPSLLGKKCVIYSGVIDILVMEDTDWGKCWSL